jgi:hypothetical protein
MLLLSQTASHKILEEIIMLNKRIMSLSLAALTTAALAAPAFAATANQTVVTTTYAEIPISVTVPTTGTAQINPYGLPVSVKKNTSGAAAATIKSHQITTQPLYITNNGDTKLSIGATVTTAVKSGSNLAIVDKEPNNTKPAKSGDPELTTAKQAFVYLEVEQASTTSTAKTLSAEEKDKLIDEAANWSSATYSSGTDTMLLLSTDKAVSKSGMVEIEPMATDNDGNLTNYASGSIVLFRLDGTVTESPEEAWSTKDSFTATIAFTFKPATT